MDVEYHLQNMPVEFDLEMNVRSAFFAAFSGAEPSCFIAVSESGRGRSEHLVATKETESAPLSSSWVVKR